MDEQYQDLSRVNADSPIEYIKASEMALELGVSIVTVYEILSEGSIPGAFQLKKYWRIPRAGLEAFIRQQQQKVFQKRAKNLQGAGGEK